MNFRSISTLHKLFVKADNKGSCPPSGRDKSQKKLTTLKIHSANFDQTDSLVLYVISAIFQPSDDSKQNILERNLLKCLPGKTIITKHNLVVTVNFFS